MRQKKISESQSVGLINAVDRINTHFGKEHIDFINGSKPTHSKAHARKASSCLKFEKVESRALE